MLFLCFLSLWHLPSEPLASILPSLYPLFCSHPSFCISISAYLTTCNLTHFVLCFSLSLSSLFQIEVTSVMTAPLRPGKHTSCWVMKDAQDNIFGRPIVVEVQVAHASPANQPDNINVNANLQQQQQLQHEHGAEEQPRIVPIHFAEQNANQPTMAPHPPSYPPPHRASVKQDNAEVARPVEIQFPAEVMLLYIAGLFIFQYWLCLLSIHSSVCIVARVYQILVLTVYLFLRFISLASSRYSLSSLLKRLFNSLFSSPLSHCYSPPLLCWSTHSRHLSRSFNHCHISHTHELTNGLLVSSLFIPPSQQVALINALEKMGFAAEESREALFWAGGSMEVAIDRLLDIHGQQPQQ